MATESFKKRCRSGLANPRLLLTYDGDDYLSEFMEGSSLHKDGSLGTGEVAVTVDNSSGQWNALAPGGQRLGKAASIKMYFTEDDTDILTLFTGLVKHVEFISDLCVLYIRDKLDTMSRITIGITDEAFRFDRGVNPAEVAWRVLTNDVPWGAGYDSSKNTGNPDIDYGSWFRWKAELITHNYSIDAYIIGQSARWCLYRIAQMTNSYIWINGVGKVQFALTGNIGESYNDSNAIIDLKFDPNWLCNKFKVRYGYDLDNGTWDGYIGGSDYPSRALFGKLNDTFEDKQFWHVTSGSATSMLTHRLSNYAYPVRWMHIYTDLIGLTEDIGNRLTVSPGLLGITTTIAKVELITIDLSAGNNTGMVKIRARM